MKKLLITMGDPGGVGPEITVKALCAPGVRKACIPIVIGDSTVMGKALRLLGNPCQLREVQSTDEAGNCRNILYIMGSINGAKSRFPRNRPSAEGGRASAGYIRKAVDLLMRRQADGMVTAPISKEALNMAGFTWPGHTEMLAELSRTRQYAMMLIGGPLRVILVTIHTALKNVPGLISRRKIVSAIRLAKKACDMLQIRNPKIGVAALNPHAGEAGIFGEEEITKIMPAIRQARSEGMPVAGMFPPDSIFYKAYQGEIDIIVCMYHDQGLIPLKMIAFDKGVNVTVGLPFARTSPGHGTAYDIAWKGIANPSGMVEAIKLAARLRV